MKSTNNESIKTRIILLYVGKSELIKLMTLICSVKSFLKCKLLTPVLLLMLGGRI